MFTAASETSSTTLEWAIAELLKNPRVMKEVQAEVIRDFDRKGNVEENGIHELKFFKAVVKETLRLHRAAPLLLPRESRESCEINGFEIPEKTRVMVNAWAIGRDPRHWNEAETIYPERFLDSSVDYGATDFEYIPFGAGRRICPF
ncbi:Cytochrome P450 [Melia azedarach]|uniref:Cytochrome P450 n=1 Tax=Melia azedarach TaxID=155640 RepID=A0ACC1YN49_MELAZ|nr:Cytochrome P450 [Melia azedarach]